MTKRITIILELDDDEYIEFMEQEEVADNLRDWIFAELCQNHGLGFLVGCKVEQVED